MQPRRSLILLSSLATAATLGVTACKPSAAQQQNSKAVRVAAAPARDKPADSRAVGVACCDVVNRGASYGDGKVVYNVLDGRTIAVDAKTGKQAWSTKVANPDVGETLTMAPLIVKGRVFIGNSGGEMGVRGWLKALDLASGKVLRSEERRVG